MTASLAPAPALAPAPHQPNVEPRRTIPGYRLGDPTLPRSPLTLQELELLKRTVLFTEEDERYLRMAGEVMAPKTEAILDVWYGFVGANPHLIRYFSDKADG